MGHFYVTIILREVLKMFWSKISWVLKMYIWLKINCLKFKKKKCKGSFEIKIEDGVLEICLKKYIWESVNCK